MACRSAVVKLGGGLITVRDRPETVDMARLEAAARQIAEYVKAGGSMKALVHGGGSFGHYVVEKLRRSTGELSPLDAHLIQRSMQKLSLTVSSVLERFGLKPVIHSPHTFCLKPGKCWYEPLARDSSLGLLPVTHGDAIPMGTTVKIISGDVLAADIAISLGADCLIYATAVPGVLDGKGNVVPLVSSVNQLRELGVTGFNVTGGMKAKLEAALRASMKIRRVVIVGGDRLLEALLGENVGTIVKA